MAMGSRLRKVARAFSHGEVALEELRVAAQREMLDGHLAEEILKAIAAWEAGPWPNSVWARNELRDRVEALTPKVEISRPKPADATAAMYAAGIRGQRHHS
jgi:hypothetical protein